MLDNDCLSTDSWDVANENAPTTRDVGAHLAGANVVASEACPSRSGTNFPGYITGNIRNNRLCPYLRQREGALWLKEDFLRDSGISDDVTLSLVEDKVSFGEEFITIPLMEITEGGLRFPMPGLFRDFLSYFGLTPYQLSVNFFRIINSCVEICQRHRIEFWLCDLMGIFTLLRNRRSWKYFLTPRAPQQNIFSRLPDLEKWGNVYVEVYGAYNFLPGSEDSNVVSTKWGDPG